MFKWLTTLFAAGAVAAHDSGKAAPTELQIETTFMPEVCGPKAQQGDRIKFSLRGFPTKLVNWIAMTNIYFPLDRNSVYEWQQVRFQVSIYS